jgi:NTE family protein
MTTKRIGLVLQGGGALGAYECGVIKALHKHYPDFHVDVVSGASIGAVNAAVLAGSKGNAVKALEQLWRERLATPDWPLVPTDLQPFLSIGGTPGMSRIRPQFLLTPLLVTSIYDTAPMRQTLAEFIDLDWLNRSPMHLIVTAVDIETGDLTIFENQNQQAPFSFDMILASGSIAPNFPMTRVADQRKGKEGWYWDGGFSDGLPLGPVINVLEQYDGGDPHIEREMIVVQLLPRRSQVPTNLLEVQNRVEQLLFGNKLKLDNKFFNKIDAYIDLLQVLDQYLTPEGRDAIAQDKQLTLAYQELMGHRKIKYITITMTRPESLTGASNFSQSVIADRIECGYQDTFDALVNHGIID